MSLFNENELREFLRSELRSAVKEVLGAKPATPGEYLSVREAARIASVTGQTIRIWIHCGRLRGHKAGRVHRVRRDELEALLANPPTVDPDRELTPEEMAERDLREYDAQQCRKGASTRRATKA